MRIEKTVLEETATGGMAILCRSSLQPRDAAPSVVAQAVFRTDLKQNTLRSRPGKGITLELAKSQVMHETMVPGLTALFHPCRSLQHQQPIEVLPSAA